MRVFTMLAIAFSVSSCSSLYEISTMPDDVVDYPQRIGLEDQDSDGVIDAREQCPESVPGADVGNYGCGDQGVEQLDISLELGFANDSAELVAGDVEKIASLANYMQQFPMVRATLEGHTSKVGPEEYNIRLGMARASAVRDVLVNVYGIEPERIDVTSYGFQRLKVFGETESSHASNRRVHAYSDPFEIKFDVLRWTVYTPGK